MKSTQIKIFLSAPEAPRREDKYKNLILLDIHSSPMFDNAMIEISTMMTITSLNISNCFSNFSQNYCT